MAKTSTYKLMLLRWLQSRKPEAGFTLTELLITMVIGTIIVGTLLFGAVELLQTNSREDSRTETQRDMQAALDYMAAEVREAVYVYDGQCLDGATQAGAGLTGGCRGLFQYLPQSVRPSATTIPVLVFWRVDDLPQPLIQACAANATQLNAATLPNAIVGVPCLSRRSFSLVVYYLDTDTPAGSPWQGQARIRRYELTQFNANGVANTGWVDPTLTANTFAGWPFDGNGNNVQTATTLPDGSPNRATGSPTNTAGTVLVDFVDRQQANEATSNQCPQTAGTNVLPFVRTPTTNSNSFYACVRGGGIRLDGGVPVSNNPGSRNQEVAIFLRGNAAGRGGVPRTARVRFEMATQALTRGSYLKTPAE